MDRHPSILSAASNLLGICFLIITGLSLTKANSRSYADEAAWVAAICFLLSIALAYSAIRSERKDGLSAIWADRVFMLGVATLTGSIAIVGYALT